LVKAVAILPTLSFVELPTSEFAADTGPEIPVVPLPHVAAPAIAAAPLFQKKLPTT
jgi:hypothetical protein